MRWRVLSVVDAGSDLVKLSLRSLAALLFLTVLPSEACAHLVNTRLGDFYDGILHPLTGFDFALPWLALAILAAFQGKHRGRWLVLVFPLGLLAGALLSVALPRLGFVLLLNVATFACIGLMLAMALVMPLPAFLALGAIVSLLHGYENGQEMVAATDRFLFTAGVMAIGYMFVALVTGAALAFLEGPGGWRPIALRAGGSWIAAVGIMVLGFQLVGLSHAG
jgi:urease accessory protein